MTIVRADSTRRTTMKKLMTLMLGLSLALGSVAVTFAQNAPKEEKGKGKGKGHDPKKKGAKQKNETPKKGG
jgi:hypothetical protein